MAGSNTKDGRPLFIAQMGMETLLQSDRSPGITTKLRFRSKGYGRGNKLRIKHSRALDFFQPYIPATME
jgi:hypothetical protein